jgi:hypothetical protein
MTYTFHFIAPGGSLVPLNTDTDPEMMRETAESLAETLAFVTRRSIECRGVNPTGTEAVLFWRHPSPEPAFSD